MNHPTTRPNHADRTPRNYTTTASASPASHRVPDAGARAASRVPYPIGDAGDRPRAGQPPPRPPTRDAPAAGPVSAVHGQTLANTTTDTASWQPMAPTSLTRATNILTTHIGHRTALLRALDNQTDTGLRAAAYDTDGPSAGTDQPPRPDPTGETATRPDRARQLRNELRAAENQIIRNATPLAGQHADIGHAVAWIRNFPYLIDPPDARQIETAAQAIQRITAEILPTRKLRPADLAHLAEDGEPGCQSCNRIGWWNEPTYNGGNPTTLGDTLPKPTLLCRACYRFTLENDRPPNRKELAHRRDDPRGHWPTRHTTAA